MRIGILCCVLTALLAPWFHGQSAPLVDYHQHLYSPAIAKLSTRLKPFDAGDLIALLDSAGIQRALVLSLAYQFGNPNRPAVEDEYAHVKAENDWTSRQVSRFPGRLRAFCSLNPLKDYALQELARCAKDPHLRVGLKLHFGNSDIDLDNPKQVEQLRRLFQAANERGMAIVVHMRSSVNQKRPYGRRQAQTFLKELVAAAPDVPIQIAHLAGAGKYDDPTIDEALAVFVEAVQRRDPRMAHIYFDVSGIAGYGKWLEKTKLITSRIRQLGVQRVLYGSDSNGQGNLVPREGWAAFHQLPLSEDEFQTIRTNLAPYMR